MNDYVNEKEPQQVIISADEGIIEVTRKNVYKESHKYFTMIQELRMKNSSKPRLDLLERLAEVSRSAFRLFNEIKLRTDRESLIAVMYEFGEVDKHKRREINRRLAELRKQDLIIKLKTLEKYPSLDNDVKHITLVPEKLSFMLNPYLLFPRNYKKAGSNNKRARLLWHFTKGEGNKVKEILKKEEPNQ